jgi:hypothetical protein
MNRNAIDSRMYMANHNLNRALDIALGDEPILVPATDTILKTNNIEGHASLGKMARECRGES